MNCPAVACLLVSEQRGAGRRWSILSAGDERGAEARLVLVRRSDDAPIKVAVEVCRLDALGAAAWGEPACDEERFELERDALVALAIEHAERLAAEPAEVAL